MAAVAGGSRAFARARFLRMGERWVKRGRLGGEWCSVTAETGRGCVKSRGGKMGSKVEGGRGSGGGARGISENEGEVVVRVSEKRSGLVVVVRASRRW